MAAFIRFPTQKQWAMRTASQSFYSLHFFLVIVCVKWQQPCSLKTQSESLIQKCTVLPPSMAYIYFYLGSVCRELMRALRYQFKGEKRWEFQRTKSLLISDGQPWNRNSEILLAMSLRPPGKFYWLLRKKGQSPLFHFCHCESGIIYLNQRKKAPEDKVRNLTGEWCCITPQWWCQECSIDSSTLSVPLGILLIPLLKCPVSQGSPRSSFQQQKADA